MPNFTSEQLLQAVLEGKVGGVSIDTSVFEQYQFGFEVGVLAQLSQLPRIAVDHVMVDLVAHEIRDHLRKSAEQSKRGVKNALKPLQNSWGISSEKRDEVMASLFQEKTESARTEERFNEFLEDSGAVSIKAEDYVKVADLVSRYTKIEPPFGAKDSKKNEFPDALSLLALEAWIEDKSKGNQLMLVVSNDGDWKRFCEASSLLVCVDDLPAALSHFHAGAEGAVKLFRQAVADGTLKDFDSIVLAALNEQAEKIVVDMEGDSNFYYEEELDRVTIAATAEPFSQQLDGVEVVDYNDGELLLQATLTCEVEAQFVVTFQHWDGIDKEYMPMGSGSPSGSEEINVEVLLTILLEGGKVILDSIELVEQNLVMEFSDIRPDWMDEDEPYLGPDEG